MTDDGSLLALGSLALLALAVAIRAESGERIPGGLSGTGKGFTFDEGELAMGLDVERQHTDDPRFARQIARDHLVEDPRYYTHLRFIERMARP